MHLTELARYIDTAHGDGTTNQVMSHALETLRRMTIAIPRLSPRIGAYNNHIGIFIIPSICTGMYKRSLISLCIMVQHGKQYRARGGRKNATMDRETAEPAGAVADAILKYVGVSKNVPAYTILYSGDQYARGERIERNDLDVILQQCML